MPKRSLRPSTRFWGHQTLREHLFQSLTADRLPTVIIFSGPAGVGKYDGALELVQADRCTARPSQRPCGQCRECQRFERQTYSDVTVLTGSADDPIAIGDVRDTLHTFQFRPARSGGSRWLLVRNAEHLTSSAVSALLKFLEEPPPLTRTLMTTAHVDLLPKTIRSRGAVYRWHLLSDTAYHNVAASAEAVARSAGRVTWLDLDRETEDLTLKDIRQVLLGQPLPANWLKNEPDEQRSILNYLELFCREVLLTSLGATHRLLWPRHRDTYERVLTRRSPDQLLQLLNRLQQRHRRLQRNVSPRFIIQDSLAYV